MLAGDKVRPVGQYSRMAFRRLGSVALTATLVLGLAACGGDDDKKKKTGGQGGAAGAGGAAGSGGSAGGVGPGYTLTDSVEIIRDTNGVPHLYAKNDLDLFYAYGYQLAVDRLWQLDNFRLTVYGRRAEVLGDAYPGTVGNNVLEDDKLIRMFNPTKWGAADLEVMKTEDPDRVELVNAWRAGINRRVQEILDGDVPRPFGYEENDWMPELWTETDPWSVMWLAKLVQDQTLLFKILVSIVETFPTNPLEHIQLFKPARQTFAVPSADRPAGPTTLLGPRVDQLPKAFGGMTRELPPSAQGSFDWLSGLSGYTRAGSNNWVVDGQHTDNGKPLLAGDPHLGFNQSGFTYALHLNSKDAGGTFDVAGFAFVSAPGILGGQNDKIIWSPTSTISDVMDFVAVEVTDGMANIGGQMVPVETREETILVRDKDPVTETMQDVPGYGVLFNPLFAGVPLDISGPGKEALILYTGFRGRSAKWFLELNRAESVDEFDDAMLRIPEMSYSPVAADPNGITLRVGHHIPARNAIVPGREPWKIMDGADPMTFWPEGQFIPPDQLPNSRGSTQGFLVCANNDPFGFTDDGDAGNDAYYYGSFFAPGYRAGRIHSELERLIGAGGNLTLAQMQTLQQDVNSNGADDLIPLLEAAWAKLGTDVELAEFQNDAELQTLYDLLTTTWDRRMERDSAGAVAFNAWAHFMVINVVEDEVTGIILDRILAAAPFFMIKVIALGLGGAYPDVSPVLQKPGTMDLASPDWHLLRGLRDTADWLKTKFGSVDPAGYKYSDMKVSRLHDGYGVGVPLEEIATRGGETTVNVSQMTFREAMQPSDQWVSKWGAIHRMVGRFTDDGKPEILFNMPYGNVADRSSKHFDNRRDGYVNGDYVKMPFERADVEAATDETFVLEP